VISGPDRLASQLEAFNGNFRADIQTRLVTRRKRRGRKAGGLA